MLNISGIHEGYVLDHIKAGKAMDIYHHLHLEDFEALRWGARILLS